MKYPDLTICRALLFSLIRKEMVALEPAPPYEEETRGLQKLESTFILMQRDDYDGFFVKAAYLFCSVIDGHPFSNGNKRLAVTVLTYFLLVNGYKISVPSMEVLRDELQRIFPKLRWEDVRAFHHPHEYFFYHLALIIADRSQKGQLTFRQEQSAVQELLKFIAVKGVPR
jgi:death-on-curing family protein